MTVGGGDPGEAGPGDGSGRGRMAASEIPAALLRRVRSRAVEAYPEECCGFLIGALGPERVRVVRDLPAPNVAEEEQRTRTFLIEPELLLRVMRRQRESDREVVGFYHSHPDHEAELSSTDLKFARNWPRTLWLIVPVGADGAGRERAWWLPATRDAPAPEEVEIRPTGNGGGEPDRES